MKSGNRSRDSEDLRYVGVDNTCCGHDIAGYDLLKCPANKVIQGPDTSRFFLVRNLLSQRFYAAQRIGLDLLTKTVKVCKTIKT